MASLKNTPAQIKHKSVLERMGECWQLYLMLLIPVVLTIIYKYIPMYGIQIAFRDYKSVRHAGKRMGRIQMVSAFL